MVRFSDIKEIRDKGTAKDSVPERDGEGGQVWLSDTQPSRFNKNRDQTAEETGVGRDPWDAAALYEKLRRSSKDIQQKVKAGQGITPDPILEDLDTVIDRDLIQPLFEYAMSQVGDWKDVSIHSVEVTLATLVVGKGMGYDNQKLLEIGLAALLENVGMYRIPEEILHKSTQLEPEEIDRIREHPETSARILSHLAEPYPGLAEVAFQVHERADGSGYPKGLKGPEISEYASMIGLVDTYVAMIRPRAYRERIPQPDVVRFILKEKKAQFPAKILKAFLNSISLFPLNSYVKLNNKSVGRVIATDRDHPLRPTVEILYDSAGNKQDQREIVRLSDRPLLYVVETLDEGALKS